MGCLLLAQCGLPPIGPLWSSAEASVGHPQKLLLGIHRRIHSAAPLINREPFKGLIRDLHNCPLKGIGVSDFFFGGPGRFSIGFVSKFRAEVAYLEVRSSDLEQMHGKNYFHEISDIFMDNI